MNDLANFLTSSPGTAILVALLNAVAGAIVVSHPLAGLLLKKVADLLGKSGTAPPAAALALALCLAGGAAAAEKCVCGDACKCDAGKCPNKCPVSAKCKGCGETLVSSDGVSYTRAADGHLYRSERVLPCGKVKDPCPALAVKDMASPLSAPAYTLPSAGGCSGGSCCPGGVCYPPTFAYPSGRPVPSYLPPVQGGCPNGACGVPSGRVIIGK